MKIADFLCSACAPGRNRSGAATNSEKQLIKSSSIHEGDLKEAEDSLHKAYPVEAKK